LLDADHHPLSVDVAGAEVDGFRDAESSRVGGGQERPMLGRRDTRQGPHDFVRAERATTADDTDPRIGTLSSTVECSGYGTGTKTGPAGPHNPATLCAAGT